MGSMSVSSCRCCMFVSCVHHVAVLNAAFCMTSVIYASRGCELESTSWRYDLPNWDLFVLGWAMVRRVRR